jgi:predicted transcriptional regulator
LKNFSSLLFELSSNDRLDVLYLLRKTPLKLSHISSRLDFTVQETSRNITRLSNAKLIRKEVDGLYHLSTYGEEALRLLSGFKFLFNNRDYFTNHTLDKVPDIFRTSLSVLGSSEVVTDVMLSFHNIEKMIDESNEFVWILTDQILVSTLPYLIKAVESGKDFRLIMPGEYVPSPEIRELVDNPIFEKASRSRNLENRFLDKVDVFLCLSDKEVAALAFPTFKGQFDYTGFKSENESVLEWAKTFFTYYWNRASKQVPEQLREV